jgi:hypothetical protein
LSYKLAKAQQAQADLIRKQRELDDADRSEAWCRQNDTQFRHVGLV